jgi:hypothetical protein
MGKGKQTGYGLLSSSAAEVSEKSFARAESANKAKLPAL